METPEKVRENRVRRMIYRRGYRFHKSRLRDPMALGYGLIRVETPEGLEAEGFESGNGLGLSLDELETRLGDGEWAVYRLRAADRSLLYVGSSDDPRGRWSTLSGNRWWARVKYKDLAWYATKQEAREAEARAVLTESPVYNVRLRSSDLTKSVVVRMTPQELEELDASRGQLSRSEFLRRNLLMAEPRQSGKYSDTSLPPPAAGGCQQLYGLNTFTAHVGDEIAAKADAIAAEFGWSRTEWLRRLVARAAGHGEIEAGCPGVSLTAGVDVAAPEPCPHRLPPGAWCKTCGQAKA